MSKWRAGVIRSTQITPSGNEETSAASGVWRASDAAYWVNQSLWPGTAPKDPYFNLTSLLLSGNGTNNAQNNSVVDQSPNNISFTRVGTTAVGSFSPYGTNWSNYFDSTGDYLSLPSNAAFGFGTGDFTVECWVNPSVQGGHGSSNNDCIIDFRPGSNGAYGTLYIQSSGTSVNWFVNSANRIVGSSIPNNRWTHLAVSRVSGSTRLFINGVQSGSTYSDSTNYATTNPWIGQFNDSVGSGWFEGYISNLRVIKGTGLYSSAFTPPTQPLTAVSGTSLLTCQSNRFIDNSSNAFTVTKAGDARVSDFGPFSTGAYNPATMGGSLYCEGDSGYNSAFNGTLPGDFTIETWLYPTAADTGGGIYTTGNENPGRIGWFISGGAIQHNIYGSSSVSYGGSIIHNQWNHVAIVRSGTTVTAYMNGIATGSLSLSGTLGNANLIRFGGALANTSQYMSGHRIVRGTALYTSNFTPPTTPPTAITNTMSLMNFTNAGVFDATGINNIVTAGDAKITTAFAKYGSGSIAFDGTSDWLYMRGTSDHHFASSNFTIEGWFYHTNATANALQTIYTNYTTWAAAHGTIFWGKHSSTSGYMSVWISNYSSSSPLLSESSHPPGNAWTHYALVRNGNTFTLYRNGTSSASATFSSAATLTPPPAIFIGAAGDAQTSYNYPGYIDDFRITKGIARYTANFTPPTTALLIR